MSSLPLPSAEAQAHSLQLTQLIQQQINTRDNWIAFSDFMALALFAPSLGYYSAGAHKLGAAGDFITAPELSSLFGAALAKQLVEVMQHSAPNILELGAGSGKLALDILTELALQQQLPDHYFILEVSPDLKQRQQVLLKQRLPDFFERIVWLDQLPESFNGAIIANEVLDALPVQLFHLSEAGLYERGVCCFNDQFAWQDSRIETGPLAEYVQQLNIPTDYISEVNFAARGLIHSLASSLKQGAILLIDYGFGAREYYHPQRNRGTLMCHYRHFAHDNPFYLPGLQDITAHVNFTDIAETAIEAGLQLKGYTSQAFFLINCDIMSLLARVSPDDVQHYAALSGQLQKLTSPAEMGELFKVIAFGKNIFNPLLGFKMGDLTRTL